MKSKEILQNEYKNIQNELDDLQDIAEGWEKDTDPPSLSDHTVVSYMTSYTMDAKYVQELSDELVSLDSYVPPKSFDELTLSEKENLKNRWGRLPYLIEASKKKLDSVQREIEAINGLLNKYSEKDGKNIKNLKILLELYKKMQTKFTEDVRFGEEKLSKNEMPSSVSSSIKYDLIPENMEVTYQTCINEEKNVRRQIQEKKLQKEIVFGQIKTVSYMTDVEHDEEIVETLSKDLTEKIRSEYSFFMLSDCIGNYRSKLESISETIGNLKNLLKTYPETQNDATTENVKNLKNIVIRYEKMEEKLKGAIMAGEESINNQKKTAPISGKNTSVIGENKSQRNNTKTNMLDSKEEAKKDYFKTTKKHNKENIPMKEIKTKKQEVKILEGRIIEEVSSMKTKDDLKQKRTDLLVKREDLSKKLDILQRSIDVADHKNSYAEFLNKINELPAKSSDKKEEKERLQSIDSIQSDLQHKIKEIDYLISRHGCTKEDAKNLNIISIYYKVMKRNLANGKISAEELPQQLESYDCKKLTTEREKTHGQISETKSVISHLNKEIYAIEQEEEKKQPVIQKLKAYIQRIEDNKKDGKTNFEHGFNVFKESQGRRREANYLLAKEMLRQLKDLNTTVQGVKSNKRNLSNESKEYKEALKKLEKGWFGKDVVRGRLKEIIEEIPDNPGFRNT